MIAGGSDRTKLWCVGALGVACLGGFLIASAQDEEVQRPVDLLPLPANLTAGKGMFLLAASLRVRVDGAKTARLDLAVLRTLRRIEDRTGLRLARTISTDAAAEIVLRVGAAGAAVPGYGDDESYRLEVGAEGVRLDASTTAGAMHGLETLYQLVQPAGEGYAIPAVTIEDAPRFGWRGLMIDCARHFEPMAVLKRNLDAMAAVKLNVFHWHLTEDQGFRIESREYPKLTAMGSDGLFYTQDEARELVRYAAERGIRVVPEFEMPGHSTAWLVAYPELASGSKPTGIRRAFGISDYALDPTREETYSFLQSFLAEMAAIFPDRYVHIGGDEAPAPDWKTNRRIRVFMQARGLKNNDALQAYFNQRVRKILAGLDRRMVGWDEIQNPNLPKDVVIQSWRGEASLVRAAEQGFAGVLSAPYYLDAMKPAEEHYLADPVPANTTLTAAQQKLILGGEVCMWAEHLDERTIDSRLWPRTAAVAERLWSPQTVRDVDDLYRRLDRVSVELEGLGLRHLSSEDAGLRHLVGGDEIEAIRAFARAFEPVSFGTRYEMQKADQLTPLRSFVDAVVPDRPERHRLAKATRVFLAAPTEPVGREILNYFAEISAALPEATRQIEASPRLHPLRTRTAQLGPLLETGREAVRLILADKRAPRGWKAAQLLKIDEARRPLGLVNFLFLPQLGDLVRAVRGK